MRTPFLACLLHAVVILVLVDSAVCFGAGSIPNFTYLNDKAFRHGDIEEVLTTLVKNVHLGGSEGALGILMAVVTLGMAGGERKFSKMDASRIYFGNWLRDYSQAMDIGGLTTFTAPTLMMIISVLGFMASDLLQTIFIHTFGFATAEFEVTAERLGVYLPVEHIDNPKGYGGEEPDARKFHPKLRPPVDPRELEINPQNGMKNYIATEDESWDTSTAHIRRTLLQCIAHGRKSRGKENHDQFEAFRLLGSALHTIEDLTAHSNWCELALKKMGHADVFCHVGDEVVVETPAGPAPPLVTGTFGSADFMHSVLGEGMDRLSEASMSNLAGKISEARGKSESHLPLLHDLLNHFLTSTHVHSEKMKQAEDMKTQAYNFQLSQVAPEEILDFMWTVLEWRDRVYKDVLKGIAMIPGLNELFEKLTEALNGCEYYLGSASGLGSESSALQPILEEVTMVLQEHTGKVARVIVEYAVNLVVKAWCDERVDANAIIDKILESFHHPYFASATSEIQTKMMERMHQWLAGLDPADAERALKGLTKDGVREGKNKRFATKEDLEAEEAALQLELEEQRLSAETEKEAAAQRPQDGSPVPPKKKKKERDLRGVRYKVEMRPPVFDRFDGTRSVPRRSQFVNSEERAQQPRRDADEEFWSDPYGFARQRNPGGNQQPSNHDVPYQNYQPPVNPSYFPQPSTSHAVPVSEHWFAPSHVLAEVEEGFRAAIADVWYDRPSRQNEHRRSFNRTGDPRAQAYPRARSPSLEDRWPREPAKFPEEDIEPVHINIRNNDIYGGYPRQRVPVSEPFFQRFDSYAQPSQRPLPNIPSFRPPQAGPGPDADEGPPAFFLRGQYGGPGYDPKGYNYPREYGYGGDSNGTYNKQPEYGFKEKAL
ncbi:heterokaryon incompatibility protein Het-C-domain-containing protein [Hysterangium stoloniferum]|nr:heterokaryon incompatibility protein Het-C-domain-containing protein [Hysterangium stoloniferum]